MRVDAVDLVKCLVWDLDNTLWHGTLLEGDDVHVDDEVRRVVVELDARGILQSVASRNDYDHAWALLARLGLADYFVVPKIGWGRKSDAISAIAEDLKFAQHTIAFIDDQPAERAEVALRLPAVRCFDATAATTLPLLPDFSPQVVTEDARRRRLMYQTAVQRDVARQDFPGTDEEFIRTLDVVLTLDRADARALERVAELTQRTSQMNATGVPYSGHELRELLVDPSHDVLVASAADRFGPHGAVGVVLLQRLGPIWHLKLLATSCRVVPLGVGGAILRWLINQAARAGAHLVADFRPTKRNRIMEIAYRLAGFASLDCPLCQAGLPADSATGSDVQRLHLVAFADTPGDTRGFMTIKAPVLGAGAEHDRGG